MTRNKRRRITGRQQPNLLSLLETPKQKSQRIAAAGNYTTRTIRKWIRNDPSTLADSRELAAGVMRLTVRGSITKHQAATLRQEELSQQLKAWFRRAVREEEPSATYADYLCGCIDVEWWRLAEELLADDWAEETPTEPQH